MVERLTILCVVCPAHRELFSEALEVQVLQSLQDYGIAVPTCYRVLMAFCQLLKIKYSHIATSLTFIPFLKAYCYFSGKDLYCQ